MKRSKTPTDHLLSFIRLLLYCKQSTACFLANLSAS